MRRSRAGTLLLLVFVVIPAAAVITLGIAWGAPWAYAKNLLPSSTWVYEITGEGGERSGIAAEHCVFPGGESFTLFSRDLSVLLIGASWREARGAEMRLPTEAVLPTEENVQTMLWRTGWPFRCLRCTSSASGNRLAPQNAYLFITNGGGTLLLLPLDPIWPGLILDLVFWSLAVWGLLLAARALRRARRRRRGLCVCCRYPVRDLPNGSPCPECGTPLKQGSARVEQVSA